LNEASPAQGHAIREVIMNHQERRNALVFYLINTPLPEVGALMHVLALELPQLSM
jgi:hypothetical protein